jgi:hypothetical protein
MQVTMRGIRRIEMRHLTGVSADRLYAEHAVLLHRSFHDAGDGSQGVRAILAWIGVVAARPLGAVGVRQRPIPRHDAIDRSSLRPNNRSPRPRISELASRGQFAKPR